MPARRANPFICITSHRTPFQAFSQLNLPLNPRLFFPFPYSKSSFSSHSLSVCVSRIRVLSRLSLDQFVAKCGLVIQLNRERGEEGKDKLLGVYGVELRLLLGFLGRFQANLGFSRLFKMKFKPVEACSDR